MTLTYRTDPDLEFLAFCDESDLSVLARYLTHDRDGKPRTTEQLTSHPEYLRYARDPERHRKCWQLIAAELQHFGGDTIANLLRGQGVTYNEILRDVCSRLNVSYKKDDSTIQLENKLLEKIISDAWEKLSNSDQRNLLDEIGIPSDTRLLGPAALAAIIGAIRSGGFMSYRIAVVVANSVSRALIGRGLTVAANQGLVRTVAILGGPVGWVISALLFIPVFTGPAYRVTIPAVLHVAYMRKRHLNNEHFSCSHRK